MQNKPVILLGAGGHAKVLLSVLNQQGVAVTAVCAPQPATSALFNNIAYLAQDDDVLKYSPQQVELVNGIGALPGQSRRRIVFEYFTDLGYQFRSVIANSAIVADSCQLAQGVQILPGAIVNAEARIDANVLINSGAIIEHDCILHAHTVVSPGAVLCGGVTCGENCYIGAGATVIQGLALGKNSMAAAGSTVVRNLLDNQAIYGAKPFVKNE